MSKQVEDGLNEQQELFCREYLKDLNGTAAAQRAGYSPENSKAAAVQAHRLLDMPKVQAFLQGLMDERAKRTEVSADYVLMMIKETVERCAQKKPVMEWCPEEKRMVPNGEWKFEHGGVLKGCELLGKHLKLFTEKVEHSGKVTLADIVAAAAKDEE